MLLGASLSLDMPNMYLLAFHKLKSYDHSTTVCHIYTVLYNSTSYWFSYAISLKNKQKKTKKEHHHHHNNKGLDGM